MKAGHRWLLAGALAAGIAAAPTVNAAQKHKIFLSMSYIGNDWQAFTEGGNGCLEKRELHQEMLDF